MSTGGQLPEAGGQLDLCTQHRAIGGEGAGETGSVVRMNRTSLGAGRKGYSVNASVSSRRTDIHGLMVKERMPCLMPG